MKKNNLNLTQKFFNSYLFLIILIITAVMVSFSYIRTYYQDYQIKQEIKRLEEDSKKLQTKKIESLEALRYARSDEFVRQKARTEFNMAKIGEKSMYIKTSSTLINLDRQASDSVLKWSGISNYRKWWNLFMEN